MIYTFDTEFHEHQVPHGVLIEPISIGMVCEDKRSLYLEFSDFDWSLALANPFLAQHVLPQLGPEDKRITRAQGMKEIVKFVDHQPAFWAFFDHYDWVVLCAIFGGMTRMPGHWSVSRDLRQEMLIRGYTMDDVPKQESHQHHALADALWNMRILKWMQGRDKLREQTRKETI